MKSTEDDIKVRKALAWTACHKLRKMWTSSLKRSIKVRLFIATVESVCLYNSKHMDINETDGKEAGWGAHPDVAHGNECVLEAAHDQ